MRKTGNIYDIHCHILPKVDDGAGSLEEALKLIGHQMDQGVAGIVLTPHFRHGMFETPEDVIYASFKILEAEAREKFPEMELRLGCEVHASSEFEEDIKKRKYMRMSDLNMILLEFSGMHQRSFITERINAVMGEGIAPILAHVERIPALGENPDFIADLKNRGVMIQVNADAVIGKDGRKAKGTCKKLLKKGLVDFIGSDTHNTSDRSSNIGECAAYVAKKYGEERAYRIFYENPEMFFI